MATDLDEIEIFHAVATSGGITAAAHELALPKSTVSRRLAKHEERLGIKLFNKTTRRLVLTEIGRQYLECAASLSSEIRRTRAFLDSITANPAGTLRITTVAEVASFWLADFLVGFSARHPGLSLSLVLTGQRVDIVGEHFDVAIRLGPMPPSELVARRFAVIDRAFYATPEYLAAAGIPADVADLARFRFVLLEAHTHPAQVECIRDNESEVVAVAGNLIANSLGVVKGLVLAGGGIGAMPPHIVRDEIASGRLVRVLPGWEARPVEVSYVIAARKLLPAKTRLFVDELVAHFRANPSLAGLEPDQEPAAPGRKQNDFILP